MRVTAPMSAALSNATKRTVTRAAATMTAQRSQQHVCSPACRHLGTAAAVKQQLQPTPTEALSPSQHITQELESHVHEVAAAQADHPYKGLAGGQVWAKLMQEYGECSKRINTAEGEKTKIAQH